MDHLSSTRGSILGSAWAHPVHASVLFIWQSAIKGVQGKLNCPVIFGKVQ